MIWYPLVATCRVADNISHLLTNSMESWQTNLMSENEELARVNYQRGIFQGYISFIVGNCFNSLKSYPSKSKCRNPALKEAEEKYQSPSFHV